MLHRAQPGRLGPLLAAVAIALLPKCPACWSAYAGLSSLLGLSFVVEARYLLPLSAASLGVFVGALTVRAPRGRRYVSCLLGTLMGAGVLFGKFVIESDLLTIASLLGVVLLALPGRSRAASKWRLWRASLRTAP